MEFEFKYRDGMPVRYQLSDFITGTGIIRGVATTPLYGIGAMYIVEDTSGNLPNKNYPFRFFTVAENFITSLN